MSEIREDIINNDIIIFSKNRSKRPMDNMKLDENNSGYNSQCPFCEENESKCNEETYRIEVDGKWKARSVYNKYPIIENDSKQIRGVHEVIIDTSRHNGSFYNMSIEEFRNMLLVYRNRFEELSKDDEAKYISIFKNFRREAGASLAHPHSQIISMSIIPPDILKELSVYNEYVKDNNKDLYSNIIEEEIKENERVIHNSHSFLTFVPKVSKYTGEVRIMFKEKKKFSELENCEIDKLSYILHNLFKKIKIKDGEIPFNLYVHTQPLGQESKACYNVHIHIIPRKYSFGGFELSTGVYVSSRSPKDIANSLKFN